MPKIGFRGSIFGRIWEGGGTPSAWGPKIDQKSILSALGALERSWGRLESDLGVVLGGSWALLGASWAVLGANMAPTRLPKWSQDGQNIDPKFNNFFDASWD